MEWWSNGKRRREKLMALVLGVAAVGLILWGTHSLFTQSRVVQALLRFHNSSVLAAWSTYSAVRQGFPLEPVHGAFILATICSAGFWTLVTRSTIGGIVFSVASQFLAVLGASGAALALQKGFGFELPFELPGVAGDILVGVEVLIYCAIFLWLGWRRFANLELTEGAFGEVTSFSVILALTA